MPKRRGPVYSRGGNQKRGRRTPNVRTGGYIGLEKKFVDQELDDTDVTETGQVVGPIGAVAQGNGDSQRIGRKQFLHSLFIRGYITEPAQATSNEADNWFMIALVLDRQTNEADMTLAQLYAGTPHWLSWRNLENSERFQILKQKMIHAPPKAAITAGADGINSSYALTQNKFEMMCHFKKPLLLNYSGTSADISDLPQNSLH